MMSKETGSHETARLSTNKPGKDPNGGQVLTVVDVAAATHTGHVKNNNEDHYLVIRFGRSLENLTTNLEKGLLARSYDVKGYGMFVADGIGGITGGQVASRMSLTRLVELLVETPDWIMSFSAQEYAMIVLQRMKERFLQIDETLRLEAKRVSLHGMGTTLTVAGTLGRELVIGHIGDSRAYLLRADKLNQLTTDHTLAQALIDAGVADANDPAARSMRHVLTAALGSLGEVVQPQVHRMELSNNDQLLLCTDGLTDMVDDQTIASVMSEADSAERACRNLVELALAAGGLDNITAVLARFGHLAADGALSFPPRSLTAHPTP